jgi:ABC-type antimicrobial peptide transport system permease subunit
LYLLDYRIEHVSYLLARVAGDAGSFLPSMRNTIEAQGRFIVVKKSATMPDLIAQSMGEERSGAFLSGAFSTAALGLAAMSMFGLTSHFVRHRRREMAIRAALGAVPSQLRRLVVRDLASTFAAGTAIGAPAAYAVSVAARSLVFGSGSASPWLFVAATATLALASAAAAALPVRRVGRIDAALILRE